LKTDTVKISIYKDVDKQVKTETNNIIEKYYSLIASNMDKAKKIFKERLESYDFGGIFTISHLIGLIGFSSPETERINLIDAIYDNFEIKVEKNLQEKTINVRCEINYDKVYEATPAPGREGESWAKDVEEGRMGKGFRFLETTRARTSRTGLGIMVTGLEWEIKPMHPIRNFIESIKDNVISIVMGDL
jgi:hypothetical protein